MSSLTLERDALVYRTPFNRALVDDLKLRIPTPDRQWDHAARVWRIAPQHGQVLVDLTRQLGTN